MKTYSHLAERKKIPSEYEIATTKLFWHVERGFEVAVPLAGWYRARQTESPLARLAWDRFADPQALTYAKYVRTRAADDRTVEGFFAAMDDPGYARRLKQPWLELVARAAGPARHLFHGLQMAAAYVGQMAPSSRLTVAAAFQAADELRRIHWFSARVAQLAGDAPGVAAEARGRWEKEPAWQPLRRAVEELLVTWDFSESLLALSVWIKPVADELFIAELKRTAERFDDPLFAAVLGMLERDASWHRDWVRSLFDTVVADDAGAIEVARALSVRWRGLAGEAAEASAPLFGLERPSAELIGNQASRLAALRLEVS